MSEDIVATLRMWAKNANEQGVSEAVIGLHAAADEIERLRAELRTYTGDGHNTKGEPCTQNTPS